MTEPFPTVRDLAEQARRVAADPFSGNARFAVIDRLGEGAFGTVYRVLDRQTGSLVALKHLRRVEPDALFRLKKEFRSLVELRHPNLVRLRELHEDAGRWFFTMELVEGTDFFSYVRPNRATFDEERLRSALLQLALAIRFLHVGQKVHRDIKPANVRVNAAGRLVLLDFGLVSNTVEGRQTTDAGLAGTLAYMAPEQALGQRVGPEADWYAFGVVLYEALTGRIPSPAWPPRHSDSGEKPLPPRELDSAVPEELNALCMELLCAVPEERPSGQAVVECLGAHASAAARAVPSSPSAHLVGRHVELESLLDAYERLHMGAASFVFVHGESGVGKSALLQQFARALPQSAVTLRARCFEQETLPYKAFDGVVDALSTYLIGIADAECAAMTPRRAALLPRIFPVLGRVPSISAAPQRVAPVDDVAAKNYAFAALRDLLALLGDRRALIILIDDVQWADPESLALLERVMAPPDAPNALLVLAGRPLGQCSRSVQHALSGLLARNATEIPLAPLSPTHSDEILRSMLGDDVPAAVTDAIARECAGNPLLLSLLATRAAAIHRGEPLALADAVKDRLSELPHSTAILFAHLCIAAAPLSRETLAAASGVSEQVVDDLCAELSVRKLVRSTGSRGVAYEVFHDRIRASVVCSWPEARRKALHASLAEALERAGAATPELIAQHFVDAGQPERAAQHAVHAAERAHDALAFERAVHFYRVALNAASRSADDQYLYGLRVRLGDALSACGRSADAADAYLAAAFVLEAQQSKIGARDLRIRAAHCLLASGHGERGSSILEKELRAVGLTMPKTRASTMTRLAWSRARHWMRGFGYVPRAPSEIDPRALVRVDACAAAATGLVAADPWRSAYFQSLFLELALESGDLSRIALALAREGMYRAHLWTDTESSAVQGLLATVDSIARELQEPKALAMAEYLRAVLRYCAGRFQDALPIFRRAHATLGPLASELQPELMVLQQLELTAMQHQGLWRELAERIDEDFRSATERGDLFTAAYLQLALCPLLALARDDVVSAESHVSNGPGRTGASWVLARHLLSDFSTVALRIYTGRCAGLAQWGIERTGIWREGWILSIPMLGVEGLWVQARAILAELTTTAAPSTAHAREVRRLADKLQDVPLPYGLAYAEMSRGALDTLYEDQSSALAHFTRAQQRFEECGMTMLAHIAMLRRSALMGEAGHELRVMAESFMTGQSVKRPLALAQVYAPLRENG